MTITADLSVETTRLDACESIIARGLASFVDVGNALIEIRDEGLYREVYSTFEDYCRERWGIERAHAYRLIRAAEVVSPIGDINIANEAQARELTGLEPETAREVYAAAAEKTGGKVTAAALHEAREEVAPRQAPVVPAAEWRAENEATPDGHRHEIFGKAHHLDTNRILSETVVALEGARIGLGLIRFDQADPAQRVAWSDSLLATGKHLIHIAKELKK